MLQLSKQSRSYLLELARRTLQSFLESGVRPSDVPSEPELLEKRGVFVTLEKKGQLRGCIGFPFPTHPLYLAVVEGAIHAATQDPRFERLELEELPEISIEISVLSALKPMTDLAELRAGVHGLVVTDRGRRGLLLPQVAVDRNWSIDRFLEETCRKAGLPRDAWKRGAQVEYFTALVFSEEDAPTSTLAELL
ncbi:MAG: AmmeMemoRadiSam system protein A [Acidobacteriota bacterium]